MVDGVVGEELRSRFAVSCPTTSHHLCLLPAASSGIEDRVAMAINPVAGAALDQASPAPEALARAPSPPAKAQARAETSPVLAHGPCTWILDLA